MHHLRFQFKLFPTLALVVGLSLFSYLGLWQQGKATRLSAELNQRALRAQQGPVQIGTAMVDADQLRDAPVSVVGIYETQKHLFLDNRQENGVPGVHVITPLKIEGSETRILINRGWVGWAQGRGVLPHIDTPSGRVQVTGLASVPSTKKFWLMPDRPEASNRLWSRLDMERLSAYLGQQLQPVVLLQNSDDASDTLVRRWAPPEDRVGMHQSYAVQWFGMAAALIAFYLVASIRKGNPA